MFPINRVTILFLLFVGGLQELARAEVRVSQTRLLSEYGASGVTDYGSSNKIVTLGGKTHVAWLDSVSETMVASFDHATGSWTEPVKVGTGIDNHGIPALTCDSSGYLHIIYGPHGRQPFQHSRSAQPNNAEKWVHLNDFGENPTYPSLVCDDEDTLHITYRGGDSPFKLVYQRRPKGGDWSEPLFLAKTPGKNYSRYNHNLAIAGNGTLHLTYILYYPEDGKKHFRWGGHLMSLDREMSWTLADGTPVKLPIESSSDAIVWKLKEGEAVLHDGLACSNDGRPWIMVSTLEAGAKGEWTQTLTHHDGKRWHHIKPSFLIPPELQGESVHRFGMMTIDTKDRIYLMTLIGGQITVRGSHVAVAYSDDKGKTFQVVQVFPPAADKSHIHGWLNIERSTGNHSVETPWLLFYTGMWGSTDNIDKGIFNKVRALQLSISDCRLAIGERENGQPLNGEP